MLESDARLVSPIVNAYFNKFHLWEAWRWNTYRDGTWDGVYSPVSGDWIRVNYYDQAHGNYAAWAMSGFTDDTLRDRARAIASHYIDSVTNQFTDFNIPPYSQQIKGAALYYADIGSTDALNYIDKTSCIYRGLDYWNNLANPDYGDTRTTARTFSNYLIAAISGAPSTGYAPMGIPGGYDWAATAREALNRVLARRVPRPTQAYGGWASISESWGSPGQGQDPNAYRMHKVFQNGLMASALIMYHDQFEADPRIPVAIEELGELFWESTATWFYPIVGGTFVLPEFKCLRYMEGPSNYNLPGEQEIGGGPQGVYIGGSAVNLNGLLINIPGWLYSRTGDPKWKARAEVLIDGICTGGEDGGGSYVEGQWQFNETFAEPWRSFSYLYGSIPPPTIPTFRIRTT